MALLLSSRNTACSRLEASSDSESHCTCHCWALAPARGNVSGKSCRAQYLRDKSLFDCNAGWREFVTLTALFDCDAGFLVNDTVVFSADVLVLRESSEARSVRSLCLQRPRFIGIVSFWTILLWSSDWQCTGFCNLLALGL